MIPVRSTLVIRHHSTRLFSFEEEAEEMSRRIFEGLGVVPEALRVSSEYATASVQISQTLHNLLNQPIQPTRILMNPEMWNDIMQWSEGVE